MTVQRMFGLSGSGLDVDSMVKQLMTAKRAQYNYLYQDRDYTTWKKEAYNDIYSSLKTFQSTVSSYKLSSALSIKAVSSSNTAAVTATANADAANIGHDINVTDLATGVKLTSSAGIASASDKTSLTSQFYGGTSPGTFSLKIANGSSSATITVDPSKSIYDLVSQINNAGINVTANYDATLDRFFMNTTNTGASSGIDFTGSDANALSFLTDKLKVNTTAQTGTDAKFTLDNVALTQASNSFTISGVKYSLNAKGSATINVAGDTDKMITSIQNFVDQYNTLIDSVNTKLSEKRDYDYKPLTPDQLKEMKASNSQDDIDAWQQKAKTGILQNDSLVTKLFYGMRNALSNPVSGITGKYTTAASIGITTGSYEQTGHIYLDTEKLKTALNNDPEAVSKIFGTNGASDSTSGISFRLDKLLKQVNKQLTDTAGVTKVADTTSVLGKQITSFNTTIKATETKFTDWENQYYTKYTQMEQYIQKMNSQSSWLSQQFSS